MILPKSLLNLPAFSPPSLFSSCSWPSASQLACRCSPRASSVSALCWACCSYIISSGADQGILTAWCLCQCIDWAGVHQVCSRSSGINLQYLTGRVVGGAVDMLTISISRLFASIWLVYALHIIAATCQSTGMLQACWQLQFADIAIICQQLHCSWQLQLCW